MNCKDILPRYPSLPQQALGLLLRRLARVLRAG